MPATRMTGVALSAQLEQVSILSDLEPDEAYVDRVTKATNTAVFIAGQQRNLSKREKKRQRRRNTIEPIIGHMKADGKLGRCFLKGQHWQCDTCHIVRRGTEYPRTAPVRLFCSDFSQPNMAISTDFMSSPTKTGVPNSAAR